MGQSLASSSESVWFQDPINVPINSHTELDIYQEWHHLKIGTCQFQNTQRSEARVQEKDKPSNSRVCEKSRVTGLNVGTSPVYPEALDWSKVFCELFTSHQNMNWKMNRLPVVSSAKVVLFSISKEVQCRVCNQTNYEQHLHTGSKGEVFHRREREAVKL